MLSAIKYGQAAKETFVKKLMLWLVALAALAGGALHAQDITGNWQGTLTAGKQDLRLIVVVTKDDGRLQGKFYSIDQQGVPVLKLSSISQDGPAVKFTIDLAGVTYEGKLSADGSAIAGTWTQGSAPLPLNFARATKETAWEIPAPPPPPKTMAADADPSFDVATIKPNPSGGSSMQQLTINGRDFKTVNSSLSDLIQFAYNVQSKQIVGAPDWIDKDRYDIAATPDQPGAPSLEQLRTMIRKLLAERFQLKFHNDKRELSAFVLTVDKNGSKLKPTQLNGPLPGIGMRPGPTGPILVLANATMENFTGFLQGFILDRPVVDQTAQTGRYDINVPFTPDDSMFNGHPPPFPKVADGIEPAPGLFEAIQQTLGLKLTAEKTQVSVIAVDHVEKPSAN
jgi:uncharacterized protein (TIGR03435 family)